MSTSTLTQHQVRTYGPKPIAGYGNGALIKAQVRYDDHCNNGHNSFAITGTVYIPGRRDSETGGCMHDEIAKAFPELAPFIKWHLCSSDGPLHYCANTLYWAGKKGWCDGKAGSPPNLDHARDAAIWPDATDDQIANVTEEQLQERLPALLVQFRAAVESLGFTY